LTLAVLDAPIDPVEGGCANDYTYVHGDPINTSDLDGMADPLKPCGGTNISESGVRLTIAETGRNDIEGWVEYNINFEAEGRYARKAIYTTLDVTGRRTGSKNLSRLAAIDSRIRDATRSTSRPYYAHTTQRVQQGSELRLSGQIDYRKPWYGFGPTGVTLIGACRA
jgi:hypothetical protein